MFSPFSLLLRSYPSSFSPLITIIATVYGASVLIAGTMLRMLQITTNLVSTVTEEFSLTLHKRRNVNLHKVTWLLTGSPDPDL